MDLSRCTCEFFGGVASVFGPEPLTYRVSDALACSSQSGVSTRFIWIAERARVPGVRRGDRALGVRGHIMIAIPGISAHSRNIHLIEVHIISHHLDAVHHAWCKCTSCKKNA